jgi:hypothetical protein
MNTHMVKRPGLPQDNPFGIWLSKFEFSSYSEAEDIATVRDLPKDGPFYLFRPEWLRDFNAITESRVAVPRVRKSGATARPARVAPDLAYGEQMEGTVIVTGNTKRSLSYEFRRIDDDCFFDCVNADGEEATGVDMAPYFIRIDYDNEGTDHSRWNRYIKDRLSSLLTRSTTGPKDRLVEEAMRQSTVPYPGTDLVVVGFAAKCAPGATIASLWAKLQLSPGVYGLRKNITLTDQLVIDPEQPLGLPSGDSGVRAWADKMLESSQEAAASAAKEISVLERKLSEQKRLLGSLNMIMSSTTTALRSKFTDMFERLGTDSRVAFAGLRGSTIVLRTQDVWVPIKLDVPDGPRCFLGQYEFRVTLTSGIKIRNLKLPDGEKRIHPHGYEDSVCLGTYSNTINNCFLAFDYYTVMLTLLEWTTDINPEDYRAVISLGAKFKATPPDEPSASKWCEFVEGVHQRDEDEGEGEDDEEDW